MKTILTLIASVLFLVSCKKEPITPGNYQAGTKPEQDTTSWIDGVVDGGTLPNWNNGNQNNELVGTTWVLTKMVAGFTTTYPNDTIKFVSNSNYTLNNGSVRPYSLSNGTVSTNKTLSLYYFAPFGGSHYSGQVGYYFVSDGQINNAEFTDLQNSNASKINAFFVKL